MLTREQSRRITQARIETQELIDKEMKYSEDLRKQDYIAGLERHIAKLDKMLEVGEISQPDWMKK